MSNRKGARADLDELLGVAWKRQKWALAHGGAITIPTPKSPAWKKYMRWGAFGFGTLLWASGIAAMYGDDYKLAVCLYFFGIAIVAADFITLEGHAEYRGLKKAILVVSVAVVATLAFGLSLAWIAVRKADVGKSVAHAPLIQIRSSLNPSDVFGATFSIEAPASVPIESIDVTVSTDTAIGAANQLSDVPDIKYLDTPKSHPLIVGISTADGPQQILVTPSLKVGSSLPELRVYCPKLLAGQSLTIVLGTITTNPIPLGSDGNFQWPEYLYPHGKNPRWIRIAGTYETGMVDNPHRYPIEYKKSFE